MSSERADPAPATTLDDRPALSAPDALSPEALADARRAEPWRGLAGLAFVLPVAVVLAVGAGGPTHSLVLLAPITTFAIPVVAMIAFWWEDWPGTMLRGGWAGLYDTAIVVVGGVALTVLGQWVVRGGDVRGVFAAGPGHPAAYPATMALAGCVFTVVLQLTMVTERWPFQGMRRVPAGVASLVLCWLVGAVLYVLVVRVGGVAPDAFGAWLTALGVWQMIWYVALRGWPYARIPRRAVRLVTANVCVLACGWATYLAARDAGWAPGRITATAGAAIASVLLVSMLFEAWPAIRLSPLPGRSVALVMIVALTALLSWALPMLARAMGVAASEVNGWVAHAALSCVSLAVILHVAVWRRWLPQPRASVMSFSSTVDG